MPLNSSPKQIRKCSPLIRAGAAQNVCAWSAHGWRMVGGMAQTAFCLKVGLRPGHVRPDLHADPFHLFEIFNTHSPPFTTSRGPNPCSSCGQVPALWPNAKVSKACEERLITSKLHMKCKACQAKNVPKISYAKGGVRFRALFDDIGASRLAPPFCTKFQWYISRDTSQQDLGANIPLTFLVLTFWALPCWLFPLLLA